LSPIPSLPVAANSMRTIQISLSGYSRRWHLGIPFTSLEALDTIVLDSHILSARIPGIVTPCKWVFGLCISCLCNRLSSKRYLYQKVDLILNITHPILRQRVFEQTLFQKCVEMSLSRRKDKSSNHGSMWYVRGTFSPIWTFTVFTNSAAWDNMVSCTYRSEQSSIWRQFLPALVYRNRIEQSQMSTWYQSRCSVYTSMRQGLLKC